MFIVTLLSFLFFHSPNDSDEVIEAIMSRYSDTCLIEEKWTDNSRNTPAKTIETYKNWVFSRSDNNLLTRDFGDFLSYEDADSLMNLYSDKDWDVGSWDANQFNTVKNFEDCNFDIVLNITEPILNENRDIALVYIMSEGRSSSSFLIVGLKKESEQWSIVGRIPRGIGHKSYH